MWSGYDMGYAVQRLAAGLSSESRDCMRTVLASCEEALKAIVRETFVAIAWACNAIIAICFSVLNDRYGARVKAKAITEMERRRFWALARQSSFNAVIRDACTAVATAPGGGSDNERTRGRIKHIVDTSDSITNAGQSLCSK